MNTNRKLSTILEQINLLILESNSSRQNNLKKVRKVRVFVIPHLIKILRYNPDNSYNKHIREMNGLINKCIDTLEFNDIPKLKEIDIVNWLFNNNYSTLESFNRLIVGLDNEGYSGNNNINIIINDPEILY
ncbi:MAG: hypothetical protein H7836_17875, partial [Magnetococcus sp. YQC-3]